MTAKHQSTVIWVLYTVNTKKSSIRPRLTRRIPSTPDSLLSPPPMAIFHPTATSTSSLWDLSHGTADAHQNDSPNCQSTTELNMHSPGSWAHNKRQRHGSSFTPTQPASDAAKTQTKLEIVLLKAKPRSCFSTHGSTNHWQLGKTDAAGFILLFFFFFFCKI